MQDFLRSIGRAISSERLGWELGWTMVYFLLTGALLWAFAALLRRAMRSFSAQPRYAAALVCLVLLVCLAPACFWAVRTYPADLMLVAPHAQRALALVEPTGEAISVKSPFAGTTTRPNANISPGRRLEAAWREFRAVLFDERLAPAVSVIVPKLPWIWLVGSSLMLIYFSCGLMGVDRLRRECDALDQDELGGLLKRLCREMRVSRRVAIGMSDRVAAPLVVGVLRPMILLPMSVVSSLSVDQLEFVLLHELAHVRRHDNFVNLLQRFVEAIAFFHPAAWRISAWVRLERELCCDAAVLRRRANPSGYAETLASLAMPGLSAPYAVASLANHQLVSRVRHIMSVQEPSMRFSSKWFVATAMALLISGGFVAVFAQTPEKPEEKKPDQKSEVGQTFTIEVQLGKDGVLQLQAAPDASYASVAELLKTMAGALEKEGKHPQIKVKTQAQQKSWTDWTAANCRSCHQETPHHGDVTKADVVFSLNSTCQPGVVQWLQSAAATPKPLQDAMIEAVFSQVQPTNVLAEAVFDTPQAIQGELLTTLDLVRGESVAWSVDQAVGPPNTFVYGDQRTAWASKSEDAQGEWLLLTYDATVDINGVLIHETYNPGAVVRVDAILPDNGVVVLWSGEPKAVSTDSPRLFFCKPKTSVKAATIRVTIASDVVSGWNEIDAVGILDGEGKVHWAKSALASSAYGEGAKTAEVHLKLDESKFEITPEMRVDFLTKEDRINAPKESVKQEVTFSGDALRYLEVKPSEVRALDLTAKVQEVKDGATIETKPVEGRWLGQLTKEFKPQDAKPKPVEVKPQASATAVRRWAALAKPQTSDAERLKEIEAELDLLQKQLDAVRAKMKATP